MKNLRSKVIGLLKAYPGKIRQIEQLKIELEHPSSIDDKELISSLSLGNHIYGDAGGRSGQISNKTMMIALHYQDAAQRINDDTIVQITQEMYALEGEVAKLERYVSLLSPQQADIIRHYYFEGHTWMELEEMLNLSRRTLFKYRDAALDELASMFQFIEQVRSVPTEQE